MSDIVSFSPLWGEWQIGELIGKGTYGAVYQATKTEYGTTFTAAVKHLQIPPEGTLAAVTLAKKAAADEPAMCAYCEEVREQLMREVKLCYELKGYTNIVAYEDHCILPREGGKGYDVFVRMEYLKPLTGYLREYTLSEKDIIRLGIDICSALEVLQRHGMVHCDVKPANIFVNRMGIFKLGDFGESRIRSAVPADMQRRGTYTYMAPEMMKRRVSDIRSDIYSLGIVLYRLLNGNRAPFVDEHSQTVTEEEKEAANRRRFDGEKLPPPRFCTNEELCDIVLRACCYRPLDRWQNPREMRRALEALLPDEEAEVQEDDTMTALLQSKLPLPAMPARDDRDETLRVCPEPVPEQASSDQPASDDLREGRTQEKELQASEVASEKNTPEAPCSRLSFRRRKKSDRAGKMESAIVWVLFVLLTAASVAYLLNEMMRHYQPK